MKKIEIGGMVKRVVYEQLLQLGWSPGIEIEHPSELIRYLIDMKIDFDLYERGSVKKFRNGINIFGCNVDANRNLLVKVSDIKNALQTDTVGEYLQEYDVELPKLRVVGVKWKIDEIYTFQEITLNSKIIQSSGINLALLETLDNDIPGLFVMKENNVYQCVFIGRHI